MGLGISGVILHTDEWVGGSFISEYLIDSHSIVRRMKAMAASRTHRDDFFVYLISIWDRIGLKGKIILREEFLAFLFVNYDI